MAEWKSGNIFVRDNGSPHETGWSMSGHQHNFDHTTYICRGKYRARAWRPLLKEDGSPALGNDGEPLFALEFDTIKEAGSWVLIKARWKHDFECLEGPGIMHCLYSHRDPQTGDVVQEYNGWTRAAQ